MESEQVWSKTHAHGGWREGLMRSRAPDVEAEVLQHTFLVPPFNNFQGYCGICNLAEPNECFMLSSPCQKTTEGVSQGYYDTIIMLAFFNTSNSPC
jgi:hypothetical protein